MANPDVQTLTADVWTKVAQAVTGGQIHKITSTPTSYFTFYKVSGAAAPVGLNIGEQRLEDSQDISSMTQIDVYVYPLGGTGKIRVDL